MKFSKRLLIKLLVAVIIIAIGLGSIAIYNHYNNTNDIPPAIDTDGSGSNTEDNLINVNIVIKDIDKNIIKDDFYEVLYNVKLLDILEDNYHVKKESSIYGAKLLELDKLITDFNTTYIAIYVNDEYSNYGVSNIKLYDGIKITFIEERVNL